MKSNFSLLPAGTCLFSFLTIVYGDLRKYSCLAASPELLSHNAEEPEQLYF